MTIIPGTKSTSKQDIYKERAYQLYLTPQPARTKLVEKDASTYSSLDRLVDEEMQKKYGVELQRFSKNELQKRRHDMAHSFIERPDLESRMRIQLLLAKEQGLTEAARQRLQKAAQAIDPSNTVDFTSIAEFLFSDYKEENFVLNLGAELATLLGNKNLAVREAVFVEASMIRRELEKLSRATTESIRPPRPTDGKSYQDHLGNQVLLSRTTPSSKDRTHPDLQNGRLNLDYKRHLVYSTGRIETTRKAHQAFGSIIHQSLYSGQLKEADLVLQDDGSYLFPVVIENLINSNPLASKERDALLKEEAALKELDGKVRFATLPDGRQIKLNLKLMHFSTQSNYNVFLGQRHGWKSTGSDRAEQITNDGMKALKDYYDLKKASLPEGSEKLITACFQKLENCTSLSDRTLLRALICELLQIPYHIHCYSSKDRTAIVAALKKGIHQWLTLELWKSDGSLVIPEPEVFLNTFFRSGIFRAYSEAALFETLPTTDQGVGISGVLDGKLYKQDRGFAFNFSILENPLTSLVLSDKYMHKASIVERTLYTALMSIASLVVAALSLALLPVVLGVLYLKYKKDYLAVGKYLLIALILLPVSSSMRQKWMRRKSPELIERGFFKTHHKKEAAPAVQAIYNQVDSLTREQYQNILKFVKTGRGDLTASDKQLISNIANNWVELQNAPSRMKALLKAAHQSPVALFRILANFNQKQITEAIQKTPPLWPAGNSSDIIVRRGVENGITPAFQQDYIDRGEIRTDDLHKLSALRGERVIPYAVQQTLTQNCNLSHITDPMIMALFGTPPATKGRVMTFEEGDASYFWLTIKERSVIGGTLSFEYSYRLKISKSETHEWSTQFASITPLRPMLGEEFDELLETPPPADVKTALSKAAFESYRNQLSDDFAALAVWNAASPIPISPAQREMKQHLKTLSTQFIDQFIKPETAKALLANLVGNYKNAKTPEGKALLLQALVTYLKLFKQRDGEALMTPFFTPEHADILIAALIEAYSTDLYSKEAKYRYAMGMMIQHLPPFPKNEPDSELKIKCLALHALIIEPHPDVRTQYQTFVLQLRKALKSAQDGPLKEWLKTVSLHRFASLNLENYCKGLVEAVSGPFAMPLTIANFWKEFKKRQRMIQSMPSEHGISRIARIIQSIRSNLAIYFDASSKFNVPYGLGKLNVGYKKEDETREVTLLRHGTPVAHHDPFAFIRRLLGIEKEHRVPEVAADYLAYTEAAQGNILHIILEDSDPYLFSSEHARVEARMQIPGDNFHALALRMDGDFIEAQHYVPKPIEAIKDDVRVQLLGDFAKTRILKDRIDATSLINNAMQKVQDLYFPGKADGLTKEEFQSFVFLTYAEITLELCYQLNIKYLEAGCKDDIDRGGAFKAILKLHALQREEEEYPGTITPEALQRIMTDFLAAPLIVSKRSVMKSRSAFVKQVLKLMPKYVDAAPSVIDLSGLQP